jgi:rhodanese-related sulfurtransferase
MGSGALDDAIGGLKPTLPCLEFTYMNVIPEITVQELALKMKKGEKFAILDVRETWETNLARLDDERAVFLPMSIISRKRKEAFPHELTDPQAEIVVMCHHGVRSADVTGWMRQQGWKNVFSLAGGIAAYAEQVDPSVGMY